MSLEHIHIAAPKPGTSRYEAVRDAVRAAIDQGLFVPGQQLPSTKSIAGKLDVSLVTVHRAMQELVTSGVLRRGQGKGTFVHEEYATRSKTAGLRIGMVFHDECSLADSYHGAILEGVRQQADELGVDIVLLRFGEDWRNECRGYIFVNPFPDQLDKPLRFGKTTKTANDGLPLIVVGARSRSTLASAIDTDNIAIGRQAVEHLHALGHRRIGFVGGNGVTSNDADRFQGYTDTCERLGIAPFDSMIIRSQSWRLEESGRAALTKMLSGPHRPTAVFAAGYYFALDVYQCVRELGLSLPGDLSVIGVDDPPSATHLSPSLTTFSQPLIKLGRMAVTELFELAFRGERQPQQVTLSAELRVRESTAAPALPVRAVAGV